MELIEIDGFKPNSKVYAYGDWIYHKCHLSEDQYYCAQRSTKFKCPTVLKRLNNGKFRVDESLHNHGKPKRSEKLQIKRKLIQNSLENLTVEEIVKKVYKE